MIKCYDVFVDWTTDLEGRVSELMEGVKELTVSVPVPSGFVVANVIVKLVSVSMECSPGT